ncbi:MAG: class I SAM-dependent methyltransferase [Blastocatellia bacterium]
MSVNAKVTKVITRDARELAYLYDLYVVPGWREVFDRIVDEEIEVPKEGKFLDAMCGTGGYALDLSLRSGSKVSVIGVDPNEERLVLARGKADVKKPNRVSFQQGSLQKLDFPIGEFDLVIGDLSLPPAMTPPTEIENALEELIRVAKKGATVVAKLTTQGSFGELFSLYWEALFESGLIEYSPEIERLISERLTTGEAEELALDAGLRKIRSVTNNERFYFKDAEEFFTSPLIETSFLDDWFAFLPNQETRHHALEQLGKIIDRERQSASFELSVKVTLLIGQK